MKAVSEAASELFTEQEKFFNALKEEMFDELFSKVREYARMRRLEEIHQRDPNRMHIGGVGGTQEQADSTQQGGQQQWSEDWNQQDWNQEDVNARAKGKGIGMGLKLYSLGPPISHITYF